MDSSMEENEEDKTLVNIDEFEHQVEPFIKATLAVLVGIIGTIILAWVLGVPFGTVMSEIQGTFIYHLIPFILSVSFFAILVYKAYIQQIRGLGYLASAVLLHGIAEFLAIISNPTGSILNRGDNTLAMIADILFPIAVVLIYFHIEFIEKLRPNLVHAIGIIGTALPLIIGGILMIVLEPIDQPDIQEIVSEINDLVVVYLGIFALIILWISLFGFRIMYGTLRHSDSPDIARSSTLVLVGFSSLLTNFILLGVRYSLVFTQSGLLVDNIDFTIHNTWLVTFSLLALILAYIITPHFAYAVPYDVYQLLVINQEEGITLYSFINEIRQEGELTHDALKSPAILAIQNLIQEIAATEGHIILIGMSDRIIVMKNYKEIVSVLITEKNSYFLNKGLEDFTQVFYKEYEDTIVNFKGSVEIFKGASKLVNKYMPFMRKESLTL